MKTDKRNTNQAGSQSEHPRTGELGQDEKKEALEAHREADKDMDADAEFSASSPNDDLDEGELARLGENTDLV